MSATAEIVVADLSSALQVPIEAISAYKGGHICWVKTTGRPEMREVECGHFTRKSVEIRSGLEEDEQVYLEPPFELPRADDDDDVLREEIQKVTAAIAETGPPAAADESSESPRDSAGRADRRRQGERPPGAGGSRPTRTPAQTP
jgi:hypothetical protein